MTTRCLTGKRRRPLDLAAALALALAVSALSVGCRGAGPSTEGESHFARCGSDAECGHLGPAYACIESACELVPRLDAGADAPKPDGGAAVTTADAARPDGAAPRADALTDAAPGAASPDVIEASSCLTGDAAIFDGEAIVFDQEDLAGLRGITTVTGGLLIGTRGTARSQLDSLVGLECLRSVSALAIWGNGALRSLEGLPRFDRLDALSIQDNDALESLDGLSVQQVTWPGGVTIRRNAALVSIEALSGLSGSPQLFVEDNPELLSLRGLEAMGAYSISIQGNAALTDLTGLEGVTSTAEPVLIRNNAALRTLEGLGATSTYELDVYENPALTTLGDLPLQRPGPIVLFGNAALTAIGLPAATEGRGLYIHGSELLPHCDVETFAARLTTTCGCFSSWSACSCTGVCDCADFLDDGVCP